jgi:hypothetical protein
VGAPAFMRGKQRFSVAKELCFNQSGFSPGFRSRVICNAGSDMALAPQETRTFFTSSATWERRLILQSNPLCDLLLEVLRENRANRRFQVHEFVFMPDHVHLILTPAPLV